MLVALLLAATNQTAIDYETVAKPLPAVLLELSELSGVEMRASKAVESDKLVIRVRGAEISKLREEIADTIVGKWSEKDGTFTIQRDEIEQRKRRTKAVERVVAFMREGRGRDLPAKLPPYDNATVEKWAKAYAVPQEGRYICQHALELLDIGALLEIPFGTRRVYSSHPNRLQLQLSGIQDDLEGMLARHNDIAKMASVANVNEPAVGSLQYESRQKLISIWPKPLKLLVAAERSQMTLNISFVVVDGQGNTVDYRTELLPIWSPTQRLTLPEGSDKPINLSATAKALYSLMSVRGQSIAADGRFVVDPVVLKQLRSPVEYDPLSLHYSEQLLGLSTNTGWNLVAHVQDEMVGYSTVLQPTAASVARSLELSPSTQFELRDGWLRISPLNLNEQEQIDRKALNTLLSSTQSSAATLAQLGPLAAGSPDPNNVPLLVPYLHLAHVNGSGGRSWYDLRFLHSMPADIKEIAHKGGAVSVSRFNGPHRDALEKWAFYTSSPDFRVVASQTILEKLRRVAEEPTEVMPNGIPLHAVMRFTVEREPAIVTAPSGNGSLMGSTFGLRTLAFFKLADPNDYEDSAPPTFIEFWIGSQTIIRLLLEPNPNYSLRGAVVGRDIDLTGPTYSLSTAPKAFKEAYEKALADAIARRGGGGGN